MTYSGMSNGPGETLLDTGLILLRLEQCVPATQQNAGPLSNGPASSSGRSALAVRLARQVGLAEREKRLVVDIAVGVDAVARLERAHRILHAGSRYAVDRARIETFVLEDLLYATNTVAAQRRNLAHVEVSQRDARPRGRNGRHWRGGRTCGGGALA